MLTREQAEQQLKQYRASKPRSLSGRKLFASPLARELDAWITDRRHGDPMKLAQDLDHLDLRRLTKVFATLTPALAQPLGRWWFWAQQAPYQSGWQRRAFRSGRATDTRAARISHLGSMLTVGRQWPQDVGWFAAWQIHLQFASSFAELFASEISHGNQQIADTLTACAFGRHPIGGPTTSGIRALLGSDQPSCWETAVTLLHNAGRQEGLRSAVLEAADLAHPGAFRRVLEAVVENDLTRFAGTVRAAGVWWGEELDVRKGATLKPLFADIATYLADPPAVDDLDTPQQLFLALWSIALIDAHQAIAAASAKLSSPDPQLRRAAARLLAELGLRASRAALRPVLHDPDLAVYATAVSAWPTSVYARDTDAQLDPSSVTALLERVHTLGRTAEVETGVIGSRVTKVGSAHAADVILANTSADAAPPEAMAAASAEGRHGAVRRLAEHPARNRHALVPFLVDASTTVRGQAFEALRTVGRITPGEAQVLEDALRRKAGDLRRSAITLLLEQPAEEIKASIARLASGTPDQQRAAVELARSASQPAPTVAETERSPAAEREPFGLPAALRYRPEDRTPAVRPARPDPGLFTRYHQGCRLLITSLHAWLSEHADTEVRRGGGDVELLSNLHWIGDPPPGSELPLPEILDPWWARVAPSLTDGGVELALLEMISHAAQHDWRTRSTRDIVGNLPANQGTPKLVWPTIRRLTPIKFRPTWIDPMLHAATAIYADLPIDELLGVPEVMARRGRKISVDQWGQMRSSDARSRLFDFGAALLHHASPDQLGRLWRLARFHDEPEGTFDVFDGPRVRAVAPRSFHNSDSGPREVADQPFRQRPSAELVARAFDAGIATRADLVDLLLGIDDADPWRRGYFARSRSGAAAMTARRLPDWASSPPIQSVVGEVRAAAIAGELQRGDLPGPLTPTAGQLRSAYGVESLTAVLTALGSRPFTRGYSWTASRESSLSKLARIHQPAPGEGADDLRRAFAAARINQKRAIEFGVYAPHWAALIEQQLDWPGFESAVWWVHAHTKDDSWSVDAQIREEWTVAVSQRTPLDAVDLVRGAADVSWFQSVIAELGEERFRTVLAAAKYASSSGGHKRAELFARALLAQTTETELLTRMRDKRHQDSVRALGLLPLSGQDDPALVARYELLRGFVATDRTSGSQRRASESAAVTIGLENLARSAGYTDPQRLTWAMEAAAVRDLAAGPVQAHDGDVTVTLELQPDGTARLSAERAGKPLKSIPAKSAKQPEVAELKARVAVLRKQLSRMRQSLEQSCVTGGTFETSELDDLLRHPILAPMLRDLVFVSAEGVLGFASTDASQLLAADGTVRAADGSPLRLAHPLDLYESAEWPDFQHALFIGGRKQPFRQLFRELYLPTAAELDDSAVSRRYAGHQVEPRRASGIFTSRGWVADFEVGFGRTFHQEKITAWCSVLGAFGTAAEVEDATIQEITFRRAGTWDSIRIDDVPRLVFSEAMRDLDLVVSVAHSGGVDPETSESSIEMRARLVDETAELLALDNVEVSGHHARIRGRLGSYSVQLGSGQVHRIPGNAVCIIPVSAQHRGRIFLPFADDDPRTAEVISKVVLLARDDKIHDPTILQQLA